MRVCLHVYVTHMHIHTHRYIHAHAQARIHTYTHVQIHAYIYPKIESLITAIEATSPNTHPVGGSESTHPVGGSEPDNPLEDDSELPTDLPAMGSRHRRHTLERRQKIREKLNQRRKFLSTRILGADLTKRSRSK